jgi:hypothetical protein
MRRSIVLSFPLQLVFLGLIFVGKARLSIRAEYHKVLFSSKLQPLVKDMFKKHFYLVKNQINNNSATTEVWEKNNNRFEWFKF